jgi:hypothetical protein
MVLHVPDAYLKEYLDILEEKLAIQASKSQLSRFLKS